MLGFGKKKPSAAETAADEDDATNLLLIRIENLINASSQASREHNFRELSELIGRGKFILKK